MDGFDSNGFSDDLCESKLAGAQAMPFQPTVFCQLMRSVPRRIFQQAVEGRSKWGLTEWAHLVTLIAAQLTGARSMRDLLRLLDRHQPALAHLGVGRVRRSTLSDANAVRPAAPFEAVAAWLCGEVGRSAPRMGREALRLIDATRIHAGKAVQHWAVDGAIKLHVVFDPVAQRTTCFAVTHAQINDITAAKRFPIEPGARYVFDKGYYCYTFWAKLAEAGCQFVTRLKANTPVAITQRRRVPKNASHIVKDEVGYLPSRLAASRKNPFVKPIRLVTVTISTGRILTLATNDLKSPATEIADLYKSRWEVELFFKWMKQNLKLHHFIGENRNAVTLQIIAAIIAHLLVRLAQLQGRSCLAAQATFRLFSHTLFQRRPISDILSLPNSRASPDCAQMTLGVLYG